MKQRIKRMLALACACLLLSGCSLELANEPVGKEPKSTGGKDVQKAEAVDNVFSLNSNSKYRN